MPLPKLASPISGAKQAVVYGLFDPTSKEVFYVGVTSKLLCNRLASHVNDARHLMMAGERCDRIRAILSSGNRPVIGDLETVPIDQWAETEEFWIGYLRFVGAELTNRATGGPGATGARQNEKTRQRRSASAKGRDMSAVHNDAVRERVAQTRRHPVVIDGVSYAGIKRASVATGIPYSTLQYRLKRAGRPQL